MERGGGGGGGGPRRAAGDAGDDGRTFLSTNPSDGPLRIETSLGTHCSMFSLAIFVSKPVRSQENLENESSYQGFSLGLFFFFFFS